MLFASLRLGAVATSTLKSSAKRPRKAPTGPLDPPKNPVKPPNAKASSLQGHGVQVFLQDCEAIGSYVGGVVCRFGGGVNYPKP